MIEMAEYGKSFALFEKLFPDWIKWFHHLPDGRKVCISNYIMGEVSLLGMVLFLFRYPSLLAFIREFKGNQISLENLNEFFKVSSVPSDDDFRYILSKVPTYAMNDLLKKFHQTLERKKTLSSLRFMDKYDLVGLDGSGHISSYKVSCPKCLTRKTRKDGEEKTLYLHGQLVATLMTVKKTISLTMAYEPIENDGVSSTYKNVFRKLKSRAIAI